MRYSYLSTKSLVATTNVVLYPGSRLIKKRNKIKAKINGILSTKARVEITDDNPMKKNRKRYIKIKCMNFRNAILFFSDNMNKLFRLTNEADIFMTLRLNNIPYYNSQCFTTVDNSHSLCFLSFPHGPVTLYSLSDTSCYKLHPHTMLPKQQSITEYPPQNYSIQYKQQLRPGCLKQIAPSVRHRWFLILEQFI